MTPRAQAVHDGLWPAGQAAPSTWAVLDAARDARIYPALQMSRLDPLALFSGALPQRLLRAAPWLIEIHPQHAFTRRLLDDGWGCAWGVFLQVREFDTLRPHLRRLLRVKNEAGRWLLFRYYDPRVLRAFLPTCRAEELRQVFGPVTRWVVEDAGGDAALDFRLQSRGLHRTRIALPPVGDAQPGTDGRAAA